MYSGLCLGVNFVSDNRAMSGVSSCSVWSRSYLRMLDTMEFTFMAISLSVCCVQFWFGVCGGLCVLAIVVEVHCLQYKFYFSCVLVEC